MQPLIDDLPEQIALLDGDGAILAVNRAWREIVEQHGFVEALPGGQYRDFCAKSASDGYRPAVEALAAFDEMATGKRSFWQLNYNGGDRWSGHDFRIRFRNIDAGGRRLVLVTRFDLTEILELRRLKEAFGDSLVESRSDERRRLGRELHDSTSQYLTAIGLTLGRLQRESPGPEAEALIGEARELLHEAQREIRSISYLAHPPPLEKLGLSAALQSMVEGYARRTGLQASFEIQGRLTPLPASAEGAVYRMAQEALSNIHRHACATRIRLVICVRRFAIHLVVADDGVGFDADAGRDRLSLGLLGMQERVAQLGGTFEIESVPGHGTELRAQIPVEALRNGQSSR